MHFAAVKPVAVLSQREVLKEKLIFIDIFKYLNTTIIT
jgi:hypothetical protein